MSEQEYLRDRTWSDRYLSTIKNIVGPLLLQPAPLEIDIREGTDLMVLKARDMRIACRVRRPGYAENYGNEFTIRSRRFDTSLPTELQKLYEGFGDWLFYGHAEPTHEPVLGRWFIVDLAAWRFHLDHSQHQIRWDTQINGDHRTAFVWFDVTSFPPTPAILVAQGGASC
ncbi:MAG: hypothetical protein HQL78_13070 [Magnetococcales bacterium]|nr:hypothetical protein [Magnetococcales bacterium]